ncbi:MAG: hypothetical protein MK212_16375 [Saprospiraceae bacterium]|nr:hypothetical protein [Saprospiraceae bacterium]
MKYIVMILTCILGLVSKTQAQDTLQWEVQLLGTNKYKISAPLITWTIIQTIHDQDIKNLKLIDVIPTYHQNHLQLHIEKHKASSGTIELDWQLTNEQLAYIFHVKMYINLINPKAFNKREFGDWQTTDMPKKLRINQKRLRKNPVYFEKFTLKSNLEEQFLKLLDTKISYSYDID